MSNSILFHMLKVIQKLVKEACYTQPSNKLKTSFLISKNKIIWNVLSIITYFPCNINLCLITCKENYGTHCDIFYHNSSHQLLKILLSISKKVEEKCFIVVKATTLKVNVKDIWCKSISNLFS